jgi:hypothetical protein
LAGIVYATKTTYAILFHLAIGELYGTIKEMDAGEHDGGML